MRNGILAGGNWIVDRVKVIDTWPAQDALASILSESLGSGGSPYNILLDLVRLGGGFPLSAVGLVGADESGARIIDDCRTNDIDTAQLRTLPAVSTSYTDVMTVEKTGRRTFFHQRGANAFLGSEHFDFSSSNARIFHLGYLLLLDRLDELVGGRPHACEVLQRARAAGLMTSLDCVSEDSQRFQTIVAPALPYVDLLFANDFEAEKLTGISLRQNDRVVAAAVEEAARRLLQLGVRSLVVVHFPEAVYACSVSGQGIWQPALQVPPADIAGAAGAGDALAAGVLLGIHEVWPLERCLELGVCAAAASLYHPTCTLGVKSIADCLALAQRLGYRSRPV